MSSKNKYPHFDFLEILLENDFHFKSYKPLIPVKSGNMVPGLSLSKDFGRWRQFVNGAETQGHIPHRQLAGKPIVIAFYSEHWGQHGLDQLRQLDELQNEVKAVGGHLVVISPERESSLEKLAWENNLSLTFYLDLNNEVAKKFRIYDDDSPVWNSFSGVDENVPLLATYVLNVAKQVVYEHIDWALSGTFFGDRILSAVYNAGAYQANLKSA